MRMIPCESGGVQTAGAWLCVILVHCRLHGTFVGAKSARCSLHSHAGVPEWPGAVCDRALWRKIDSMQAALGRVFEK